MFKKLFGWLTGSEFGSELSAGAVERVLFSAGGKLLDMGKEKTEEALEERMKPTVEWRAHMVPHWQDTAASHAKEERRKGALGLIAHATRHQEERGSDDFMMRTLGPIWEALKDHAALRYRVFYEELGHLSPADFDIALEMYHDDKIRYIMRQVRNGAVEAYVVVEEWMGKLLDRGLDILTGGGKHLTKRQKLELLFVDSVETADAAGAAALKGANKVALGIEKLIDGVPPRIGRHRKG